MPYDGVMETIHPHVNVTHDQIAAYCQRWNIVRFELFGSVLRDDFRDDSDIDVLVTFAPGTPRGLREMFAMEDDAKVLFGRDVDVVERHTVETGRNPIRRRNILSSARPVYAAV